MKGSGADMRVFKEFGEAVEKEEVSVKPVMARFGPAFKKDAGRVAQMLSEAKPEEVEAAFKKEGFFMVGEFRVLPEHVDVSRRKIVERGRRFVPHVVEPSFGSDRLLYVALEYAYGVKDDRVVLSFPRDVAPVQVGVYPLVSKDGLAEKALELKKVLVDEGFVVEFDEGGSIGRRYARADEVGVPLGVTVDYDTLKDDCVTVRDRDSWKQVRVGIGDLARLVHEYFAWKIDFEDLGKPV
jgi:glycyl-tRNA synthetase